MAERQVDDVNAERLAVHGRELDRRDDVTRQTDAVVVEDAQADQVRGGRDAAEPPVGERAAAGHEAGDVRALPEAIAGNGGAGAEGPGGVLEKVAGAAAS